MTRDQITARLTGYHRDLADIAAAAPAPEVTDAELAETISMLVTGLMSLARILTRAGDDPQ